LFAEKDLELSICGHLSTIDSLRAEIICLSDRMVCEEKQHQEALIGKEEEHVMKLSKLDERIRRVLAAKETKDVLLLALNDDIVYVKKN